MFFFLCSNLALGQQDTTSRFRIFSDPTHLLDFYSRNVATIGAEIILKHKIGVVAEYGVVFRVEPEKDTVFLTERGSYQRVEIRVYDIFRLKHVRTFGGLEYRHIYHQYNHHYSETSPDHFAVKTNVNIVNLKLGAVLRIKKHFYAEHHIGFGMRHRNVSNTHREFYSADYGQEMLQLSPPRYFSESNGYYFNPSLGLKVGYTF
jgi:hypothetical protein